MINSSRYLLHSVIRECVVMVLSLVAMEVMQRPGVPSVFTSANLSFLYNFLIKHIT